MKRNLLKAMALAVSILLMLSMFAGCGGQGPAGADGKSAYELAVEKGYTGTVEEWLASLVGEVGVAGQNGTDGKDGKNGSDGKNGADGKSAYELAIEKGYTGTLEQWLESLIGKTGASGSDGKDGTDGQSGKSAYELACEKGFAGTLSQWLDSLVGKDGLNGADGKDGKDGKDGADGKNGKSAYELACENGFEGTVTEWLASLVGKGGATAGKGADGKDGKSAYELALENGYTGTVQEWLASLVGSNGQNGSDGKSAYEIAVDNGYTGSETEWLASLVGAKGEKGNKGDTGAQGEKGEKGDKGDTGEQGEKGEKGDRGKDGKDGKDGNTPYIGANGNWWIGSTDTGVKAEGTTGAQGEKGETGEAGAHGDKGDKGDKGEKGDAGTKGEAGISVVNAYVDENLHLWIELSDGTKIDAGYVGVTVNPPATAAYTVTFVDWDGTQLKKETVESGKFATAPADPTREGYRFTGWDKTFDNVTGNLTVTAVYTMITNPTIIVQSVTAFPGSENVAVTIATKNNPGISSIALTLDYDKTVLTLTGFTYNASIGGQSTPFNPNVATPKLVWVNGTADVNGDWIFATLYFNVSASAQGDCLVKVTYDPDDVYNILEENVAFDVIDGKISISE